MRYISLDIGTKTIGIAISDKTNTLASPYKVIFFAHQDYESSINEIRNIILENEITDVVIGLPKNMDNTLGFASNRSMKFKELLEANCKLKIHLVDERLSTREAENILIKRDYKRKKRKEIIDAVAATIILDTYLRMKG